MPRALSALGSTALIAIAASCIEDENDTRRRPAVAFRTEAQPAATITVLGADTLSDSARIYRVEPEPDGGSIAFLFTDPAKGVTAGLGIVQTSGSQQAQLGWPDSVASVWWTNPHQLSFTAGTGRGVRLVVDAHAAELKTADVSGGATSPVPTGKNTDSSPDSSVRSRLQGFIDSVRVQPGGAPQGSSALRYRAGNILMAPGDTLAAVHVSAGEAEGAAVNPAWYLVHVPSGQVSPVDSLTGRSQGLPATGGQWGGDESFYYAKERTIWRVKPSVN